MVVDRVLFSAISETSPPPAATWALVLMEAMLAFVPIALRANAPANPTLVAPAPAVATALKLLNPSPPIAASLILALRLIPCAVTLAAPMLALFSVLTIFKATATPMPIALEPSTALPSATAAASVSLDVARLNAPAD